MECDKSPVTFCHISSTIISHYRPDCFLVPLAFSLLAKQHINTKHIEGFLSRNLLRILMEAIRVVHQSLRLLFSNEQRFLVTVRKESNQAVRLGSERLPSGRQLTGLIDLSLDDWVFLLNIIYSVKMWVKSVDRKPSKKKSKFRWIHTFGKMIFSVRKMTQFYLRHKVMMLVQTAFLSAHRRNCTCHAQIPVPSFPLNIIERHFKDEY